MSNANWYLRSGLMLLVLGVAMTLLACGGGGTSTVSMDSSHNAAVVSTNTDAGGLEVTADEVGSLPAEMRELLSRPGWNQPYIEPYQGIQMQAPTHAMLMETLESGLAAEGTIYPRGFGGDKSSSWNTPGGSPIDPGDPPYRGEYDGVAPAATPPFGCNTLTGGTLHGNAIEDLINAKTAPQPQRVTYTVQGEAQSNYFVPTGGGGNVTARAVYQIFSNHSESDPAHPEDGDVFAELSYRSSLVGSGDATTWQGVGPGGTCDAEAFVVRDSMWERFNEPFVDFPNGEEARVYDILIAPASAASSPMVSPNGTTGQFQDFYFGANAGSCYGSGMITTLNSTTVSDGDNGLERYLDPVYISQYKLQLTRPIFGVLLKRWQDLTRNDPLNPADNDFGWPVAGPTIFNGGTPQVSVKGRYYAFGMWFEKGFIWWLDFDNEGALTPTDEAITYRYVGGDSVWDNSGTYEQFGSNIQYGGAGGELGATVVVDSYRWGPADPSGWTPVKRDGNTYLASIKESVSNSCQISMYAVPYGGTPGSGDDCAYKGCIWAYRNGTIRMGTNDFDLDQFYAKPSYTEMSIYVVRVMVIDAVDDYAFADSYPINIGDATGGGGAGTEVMVIRNDNDEYGTNYDALIADLTDMGVSFYEEEYTNTIADLYDSNDALAAIWYRGGPAAGAGETIPIDQEWTEEEIDNYRAIMENGGAGGALLLMSQGHGIPTPDADPFGYTLYGLSNSPTIQNLTSTQRRHPNAAGQGIDRAIGYYSGDWFPTGSVSSLGSIPGGIFGSDSTDAAERYTGSGSSGAICTGMDSRGASEVCAVGHYVAFYGNVSSYNFQPGMMMSPSINGYYFACMSYGNDRAPDLEDVGSWSTYFHADGPGRMWVLGYGWEQTNTTGCSRQEMLQNVLAWLEPGLTFGGGAGGGEGAGGGAWNPYFGDPEILMVKPVVYEPAVGPIVEGASFTNAVYPDPTSTDVLRTTANTSGQHYLVTTRDAGLEVDGDPLTIDPAPNEDGVNWNDVDFQFPWYAYVYNGADDTLDTADDEVFYSGVLLENANDPDGYVRQPDHIGDAGWPLVYGLHEPIEDSAGWYLYDYSDNLNVAPSMGDYLIANYGTLPAGLTFDSRFDRQVTFETIAHWNVDVLYGTNPAVMKWSLYPGHKVATAAGAYADKYGEAVNWYNYVADMDIDPDSPTPPDDGIGGDLRDAPWWNRAAFTFDGSTGTGGRYVYFDYEGLMGWYGDLNRNLISGENEDKFPVRCRLFSQYDNYLAYWSDWSTTGDAYGYPDHMPDTRTFVEGGCYIIDEKPMIKPLDVDDDGVLGNDPADIGVTGSPSAGVYNVEINFAVTFGQIPYQEFWLDADFIPPVANFTEDYDMQNDAGWNVTDNGDDTYTATGPVTPAADGDYLFAVKVVDNVGDEDIYYWPAPISLVPGTLFTETCDGYTNWASAAAAGWGRGQYSVASANELLNNWYVGSEFTARGGPVGWYSGQMFHMNAGTDGGNGNTPMGMTYVSGDYAYYVLRSPQINWGTSSTKYLYWRARLEAGDYYSYSSLTVGRYTDPSTTSISFNSSTAYGPSSSGENEPYGYTYPETTQRSFSTTAGGYNYLKFVWKMSYFSPYSGNTAATGPHLDGIVMMPEAGAPPGS